MRRLPKWVSTIFFGILALSFGVWGIADIFRGNNDTSVATVGGTKIDGQDFSRDFNNAKREAARRLGGGQLSPARALALGHSVLEEDISNTALDNTAQNLGLLTTDGDVSATIRAIPSFQGPGGTFSQMAFQQVLANANYSEQGFVAEIRREMTRDQLVRAGAAGVQLPPGYVRAVFSYLNERRAAQYVILPPDAAGPVVPPSDQELAAFVKAHAETFSTPEFREITFASISPDDVLNQVQVTDAQIRQTYEQRKDSGSNGPGSPGYIIPEKRGINRITFPDEASAKAARAKIDAGAKFEDIAAQRGMAPKDLSIGNVAQADLGPVEGAAAFALTLNGISQPVKGAFGGWDLIQVTSITPGKTTTLDEAKPAIKAELMKMLAGSKLEDIVNAFDDARNAGDDFPQAAKKAGMRVTHVAATNARGLAPDGTKAAVPTAADFLQQVFKSDVGDAGDPFKSADGNYYVVRVDGVRPEKLKPLDEVRAQATAAWTEEQRMRQLAAKAAQIAGNANSNLAAVAAQYHAVVATSPALMRETPTPAFNTDLIAKIFSVPGGSTVYGVAADGKSFVVAQVTGVLHPPIPLGDPRLFGFAQELSRSVANDIQESMGNAARDKQGVKMNQPQVDHILGGEGS